MTKSELVEKIAEKAEMPKAQVNTVIDLMGEVITEGLKADSKVVLGNNMGIVKAIYRAPRMGRNPKTGEEIEIKERVSVMLKASKAMLDTVNADEVLKKMKGGK